MPDRAEGDTHRLAIYYAPAPDHPLARFGNSWLGRDPHRRIDLPQPFVPGLSPERFHALTASPRRYGFHATLKAPFRLPSAQVGSTLLAEAKHFAAARPPLTLSGLAIREMGSFIALVPPTPVSRLTLLASDCVWFFDVYRAPLDAPEIARRRAGGLTPDQDDLLLRWGYPFVFSEFRFHMTLTGPIEDAAERKLILAYLEGLDPCPWAGPIAIDAISIFSEPEPGQPFIAYARFPMAG
jgi:putative phosphonate metabolism protein